jgi:hypothetical protein
LPPKAEVTSSNLVGRPIVDLTGIGDTIPPGILSQTISTIVGGQYTFSIFETQDFGSTVTGINAFSNGVKFALSPNAMCVG